VGRQSALHKENSGLGDNISPNLFKIFVNDLPELFDVIKMKEMHF
jgi:hypothetical protein